MHMIHESPLIDAITRSIDLDRLRAQAVVAIGQSFLSDLISFRRLCSAKANRTWLEEGTPS